MSEKNIVAQIVEHRKKDIETRGFSFGVKIPEKRRKPKKECSCGCGAMRPVWKEDAEGGTVVEEFGEGGGVGEERGHVEGDDLGVAVDGADDGDGFVEVAAGGGPSGSGGGIVPGSLVHAEGGGEGLEGDLVGFVFAGKFFVVGEGEEEGGGLGGVEIKEGRGEFHEGAGFAVAGVEKDEAFFVVGAGPAEVFGGFAAVDVGVDDGALGPGEGGRGVVAEEGGHDVFVGDGVAGRSVPLEEEAVGEGVVTEIGSEEGGEIEINGRFAEDGGEGEGIGECAAIPSGFGVGVVGAVPSGGGGFGGAEEDGQDVGVGGDFGVAVPFHGSAEMEGAEGGDGEQEEDARVDVTYGVGVDL